MSAKIQGILGPFLGQDVLGQLNLNMDSPPNLP